MLRIANSILGYPVARHQVRPLGFCVVVGNFSSTRNGHFPCQIVNKGRKCNLDQDHARPLGKARRVELVTILQYCGKGYLSTSNNSVLVRLWLAEEG